MATRFLRLELVFAVTAAVLAAGGAAAAQSAPNHVVEYVGSETCVTCHADVSEGPFKNTSHARSSNPRTPMAARGCESCHGPGKAHADAPETTNIRAFDRMAARDVSETCTSCHNRREHAWWQSSNHNARNLSCATCHSVHAPKSAKAQLKTVSVVQTCATCHRQQAQKLQRSSHMPVREGKMDCATCHNPHGSTNVKQLRVGNWVNESCVSCHTEKRGPFLFEHGAGRESCSSCHDPHGSNHERLLVARAPMLCQRCHIGTRHPSTIYDGNAVAAKSNRIVNRGCVNCHQNIHGTNHPSGLTLAR